MAPSRPVSHLLPGRSTGDVAPGGRRFLRVLVVVVIVLAALAVLVIAILTAVGAFAPSTSGASVMAGAPPRHGGPIGGAPIAPRPIMGVPHMARVVHASFVVRR